MWRVEPVLVAVGFCGSWSCRWFALALYNRGKRQHVPGIALRDEIKRAFLAL